MIKEVKLYAAFCDLCGKNILDGEEIIAYNDKSFLIDTIESSSLTINSIDNKSYCLDCVKVEYSEEKDEYLIFKEDEFGVKTCLGFQKN